MAFDIAISLFTTAFVSMDDADAVVLEVSDTGVGMNQEVQQRCFEPFFTTKIERGNTGIGLSMVHGIIRRHGGNINIKSQPGEGTTFIVCLPVQLEETQPRDEKPEYTIPSLNVLVVDDEQTVRELLSAYLIVDGHTVQTATNGKEGLEKFYQGNFDLVITDKAMPEIEGEKLAAEIKRIAPETPVIVLTGFGDIMEASDSTIENIDYLLSKPITLNKFREALAKVKVQKGAHAS